MKIAIAQAPDYSAPCFTFSRRERSSLVLISSANARRLPLESIPESRPQRLSRIGLVRKLKAPDDDGRLGQVTGHVFVKLHSVDVGKADVEDQAVRH
jgi:hypothetical protein